MFDTPKTSMTGPPCGEKKTKTILRESRFHKYRNATDTQTDDKH